MADGEEKKVMVDEIAEEPIRYEVENLKIALKAANNALKVERQDIMRISSFGQVLDVSLKFSCYLHIGWLGVSWFRYDCSNMLLTKLNPKKLNLSQTIPGKNYNRGEEEEAHDAL